MVKAAKRMNALDVFCLGLNAIIGCAVSLWLMTQVSLAEIGGTAIVLAAGYGLRSWVGGRS